MSAPTFIEPVPETEQALTLPNDLWRAYRQERRTGSKQSVAVSAAFEAVGRFTKGDTRERLRDALIERETRDGLALTSREIEDEIAAEAAAVGAPVEPEPGSTAAIRADAQQTVTELEAARARLAPEALSDPKVRAELEAIDVRLTQARSTAELVDLAESETARREREATEVAEREAREHASAEAAKLVPVLAKLKGAVDAASSDWVTAVVALRDATEQHVTLVATATGGDVMAMRSARFRDGDMAGALRAATHGRIRLDGLGGAGLRDTPLIPVEREG